MNRFEERVVKEIISRRLFDAGVRVVCAVSGGPDSTAMTRALLSTIRETGIAGIIIAHFDHRMRPESAADAERVREFAAVLGLPFFVGSAEVRALQKTFRLSPEDAARLARRDFLLRVKARTKADAIAVGHHMTDRAETFLMHLMRGAGTRGLGAMRWQDKARFVRPLLWATKREVVEYLDRIGQTYLEDITNKDITYTRNFIRHEVFPVIENNFPGAIRKMAEAAEVFAREDEVLEKLARTAVGENISEFVSGVTVDDKFRDSLTPAVAARVVQLAYERVSMGRRTLEYKHIERVLTLEENSTVNLPGDCSAYRRGGGTVFRRAPGPTVEDWVTVVSVPGEAAVPGVGYKVTASVKDISSSPDYAATLDSEAVGGRITVRARKPGDRIQPAGLGCRKKLQDIFVDAKIPREVRGLYPVISKDDEVLGVPELVLAEKAVPTEGRPAVTISISKFKENSFDVSKING
jgi:tRNA(Ile)-lysidine synthase